MSVITDILGAGANAASGGLLGALGAIGSGIVSIFTAKAQFAHDEAMAKAEIDRIKANSDAQSRLSADQLKIVTEQGADTAFNTAQIAASNMTNVWPIVASVVALVRPAILLYLALVTQRYYETATPEEQAFIIRAMVELFSMAVSFYFGSRHMQKFIPTQKASAAK